MIISNKNHNLFITFSIIVLILYLGKNLLIPFFFSIFLFIILKSLSSKISNKQIFNRTIPYNLSFLIITILLFFIFYLFGILIENNLSVLIMSSDEYQNNLLLIFSKIKESRLNFLPFSYAEFVDELNFTKIFTNTLNLLTSLASNFFTHLFFPRKINLHYDLEFLEVEIEIFCHKTGSLQKYFSDYPSFRPVHFLDI